MPTTKRARGACRAGRWRGLAVVAAVAMATAGCVTGATTTRVGGGVEVTASVEAD